MIGPDLFFKALQILQLLIWQDHHLKVIASIACDRLAKFFPGLAITVPLKIAVTDFAVGVVDHPKDLLPAGIATPNE